MVFQLSSQQELDNLASTFKMIDKNGNGKISKQEFTEGYAILFGASNKNPLEIENEVEMIWGKIDVDGSGEIDYTEWALGTANKDFLFTEPKLQ